ncbi:BQ5605_C017g08450 [Microbotryum silenes-dioicae]|uniref:BQ5605_C017g08450 protein n=1 Tax=Microbotryum silenes-dioicae TaxID=796604 RepID=A0A2X0LUZ1_9BASI|nr:BQ5605_C017g08450 [Microbotryum silenes-dioicae]
MVAEQSMCFIGPLPAEIGQSGICDDVRSTFGAIALREVSLLGAPCVLSSASASSPRFALLGTEIFVGGRRLPQQDRSQQRNTPKQYLLLYLTYSTFSSRRGPCQTPPELLRLPDAEKDHRYDKPSFDIGTATTSSQVPLGLHESRTTSLGYSSSMRSVIFIRPSLYFGNSG